MVLSKLNGYTHRSTVKFKFEFLITLKVIPQRVLRYRTCCSRRGLQIGLVWDLFLRVRLVLRYISLR